jgi:hypothetical protein
MELAMEYPPATLEFSKPLALAGSEILPTGKNGGFETEWFRVGWVVWHDHLPVG